MGPLLVGVDGSPTSVSALRWAGWFARATGRELLVAHAWQRGGAHQPLVPGSGGVSAVKDLEEQVLAGLAGLVAQTLGPEAPVVSYRALRGDIAGSLLKEAGAAPGAVLVAGARGAGGARRALLGSVSQQLVASPTCAVVVVPDEVILPDHGESWSIVVGVDGSTGSSRAVRWVAEAVGSAEPGGRVVAVHALEPPLADLRAVELARVQEEMQRRLTQEWCAPLRDRGVTHTTLVEHDDARALLTRVADEDRPVCVVVGSRGLGPFSQRLLGSVTNRLVRELAWPVVVIPAPRDCVTWTP